MSQARLLKNIRERFSALARLKCDSLGLGNNCMIDICPSSAAKLYFIPAR